MYKIIGGDQKEYGPVSFEQIAGWIRDNRANGQTLVQKEGGAWVPLGTLPEFAAILPAQPAPLGPGPGLPPSVGPSPMAFAGAEPDVRSRALRLVNGPGIALLVTGVLFLILSLLELVLQLSGVAVLQPPPDLPPQFQQLFDTLQQAQHGPIALASSMIHIAIGAFVVFAARRMRALQSHALVVVGAVFALLPCFCPGCCVGMPVGIWVLVVLMKPEVKAAFQ